MGAEGLRTPPYAILVRKGPGPYAILVREGLWAGGLGPQPSRVIHSISLRDIDPYGAAMGARDQVTAWLGALVLHTWYRDGVMYSSNPTLDSMVDPL